MTRPRHGLALLATSTVLLALLAAPAIATSATPKRAALTLTVEPAKPTVADTIKVTFTTGKLAADQRYDVRISVPATSGDACGTSSSVRVRGARRPGRKLTVSVSPPRLSSFGSGRYCRGTATIVLSRVDVDARAVTLGKRTVALITDDPGIQQQDSTPVRMDLLDGSSLLVQAPGRPDRTLPLGGVLRGAILGKFRPNTDIQPQGLTGPIWLRSVTPDALCTGATYTSDLGISAPAAVLLKASGDASMPLTLAASPQALAGCANAPAGSTPLSFTGKVGPLGLSRLQLTASVAGVPIADGVTATVTANLFVRVDLSGKG